MCERCGQADAIKKGKWCPACEKQYDTWVRKYATDIVYVVLGGGVVLGSAAFLIPLLGLPTILTAFGTLAGWSTILVGAKLNARRRRNQFLRGADLPRAYLPAPK